MNAAAQHTGTAQPTDQHVWCFEIWPDPLPVASWPMLLAGSTGRITAATPKEARAIAEAQLSPGQAIGAGQHIRSACTPCHPGRDVPMWDDANPYAGGTIVSDGVIAAQYAAIWDAAGV